MICAKQATQSVVILLSIQVLSIGKSHNFFLITSPGYATSLSDIRTKIDGYQTGFYGTQKMQEVLERFQVRVLPPRLAI